MQDTITISIIVPFYKGNQYMERLFNNISMLDIKCKNDNLATLEVILVNDSPSVDIIVPDNYTFELKIIKNEHNVGIHRTRVNGLQVAKGDWILFLDQDDEVLLDGISSQIEYTKYADVVVGNGYYQNGDQNYLIYQNRKVMNYLIQMDRFISIRNLIPSPGECLLKKKCIPELWKKTKLKNNGSDDWFLWILCFVTKCKVNINERVVYIHNDVAGNNLSLDLQKMYLSSVEMCDILEKNKILSNYQLKKLRKAVDFKFYQDTKALTIKRLFKYWNPIFNNILYKLHMKYYGRRK